MLHLAEFLRQVRPHTTSGGIGVGKFGMESLQCLKLVHHQVKLLITHDRLTLYIVTIVMLVQLTA